jgi:hypothetical protein
MGRLDFYWEVATRLCKTADLRNARRKVLQYAAVLTLFIAYQYAVFFGYDEPRPCEEILSPVHWLRTVWVAVCPYSPWIRLIHALLPALSVAVLMKLNMPITLDYDEHARWLRSAAADIIREVYRYRCGVGEYRPVACRWSKSTAASSQAGDADSVLARSPHLIFEKNFRAIRARVLTNTEVDVDALPIASTREVLAFKSTSLTTPQDLQSTPPLKPIAGESAGLSSDNTYTPIGDGAQDAYPQVTRPLITSVDDGKCPLNAEEYVHFRLIGSRERFQEKRRRQKLRYEAWWALIIVNTVLASFFSVMRMNLSMLMCMVFLTSAMVVVDMDNMPMRLRQTGTVIQVLTEYLAAWERLSARERRTQAKIHALVDGVEDIILKEDLFYLPDFMAKHVWMHLKVTIVGCTGLRSTGVAADPYCICTIDGKPLHERSKIHTPVIKHTLNPKWDHTAVLSNYTGGSVSFTVRDEDPSKSDDILGVAKLRGSEVLQKGGFDGELELSNHWSFKPLLRVKVVMISPEEAVRTLAAEGAQQLHVAGDKPTGRSSQFQAVHSSSVPPKTVPELASVSSPTRA